MEQDGSTSRECSPFLPPQATLPREEVHGTEQQPCSVPSSAPAGKTDIYSALNEGHKLIY